MLVEQSVRNRFEAFIDDEEKADGSEGGLENCRIRDEECLDALEKREFLEQLNK